jgi:predicted nuclease of restriction endonuclease-like (RecB) superfamily
MKSDDMTNERQEIFTPALTLWGSCPDIKFGDLVSAVKNVHQCSSQAAIKAVNRYATMRNWIIGFFIVEYQQKGNDRAAYGERLLKCLEESLHIRGLNVTLFQNCRLFYVLYPQVGNLFLIENKPTLSVKSVVREFQPTALVELQSNAETIVGKLSFSHLCELVHISDDTTRLFYEKECIRCGWSVRELRRFIATNLHVRVGMSQNSDAVIASLPSGNSKALDIRQPYTFEFLGLRATEVLRESEIEDALLSHLQEFLLEMGKGFCFEARQKRFIIDDEYYYADLVFYHRILHCCVIVELKNDEFRHEHFGQLNAYVSYYKENEMHEGDNPPIGILLCTKAGKKMVEYATAGMDNKLFVSTYLLQLPDKSVLEQFIKDNDII